MRSDPLPPSPAPALASSDSSLAGRCPPRLQRIGSPGHGIRTAPCGSCLLLRRGSRRSSSPGLWNSSIFHPAQVGASSPALLPPISQRLLPRVRPCLHGQDG